MEARGKVVRVAPAVEMSQRHETRRSRGPDGGNRERRRRILSLAIVSNWIGSSDWKLCAFRSAAIERPGRRRLMQFPGRTDLSRPARLRNSSRAN